MDTNGMQEDPAEILHGIERESARAREAMAPDTRQLFGLWGAVWIIGFLAFYLASVPRGEPLLSWWAAVLITGAALLAAIVLSTVHSVRRGHGARGPSMVQGAIYGNCFSLSFVLAGLLGWRLSAAGLGWNGLLSYAVAACCLVVGALVVVGSLLWDEKSQLIFGVWVLVVGLASLALPAPHNLLAGAAGGLGLVVLGLAQSARPALVAGPFLRASHG